MKSNKNNKVDSLIDFFYLFKVREFAGIIYQNYALAGLFLFAQTCFDARDLFIPFSVFIAIGLTADVLVMALFFGFFRKRFNLMWALVHNLSIGMMAVYIFVWINEHCTHKPYINETIRIETVDMHNYHKLSGVPSIKFRMYGELKEVEFHRYRFQQVMSASKAIVTTREGYFGYYFITDVELVPDE